MADTDSKVQEHKVFKPYKLGSGDLSLKKTAAKRVKTIAKPEPNDPWPFKKISYGRFMAQDDDDKVVCQYELLKIIEKLEARVALQKSNSPPQAKKLHLVINNCVI